jgi:hypothetical protein
MPQDKTPLGDAMTHRFPQQKIPEPMPDADERKAHDIPPDNVPPDGKRDPEPGDGRPKAPPADDEPGRRTVPMDLPGREHPPERV